MSHLADMMRRRECISCGVEAPPFAREKTEVIQASEGRIQNPRDFAPSFSGPWEENRPAGKGARNRQRTDNPAADIAKRTSRIRRNESKKGQIRWCAEKFSSDKSETLKIFHKVAALCGLPAKLYEADSYMTGFKRYPKPVGAIGGFLSDDSENGQQNGFVFAGCSR